jgi:hypothetical protein
MSSAEVPATSTVTPITATSGKSRQARLEAWWAFLLISPMLIGFTIFFLIALGASFVLGFTQWRMIESPVWVGIQNYRDILHDQAFRTAMVNTFAIAIPHVVLRITIGLGLAIALNSKIGSAPSIEFSFSCRSSPCRSPSAPSGNGSTIPALARSTHFLVNWVWSSQTG